MVAGRGLAVAVAAVLAWSAVVAVPAVAEPVKWPPLPVPGRSVPGTDAGAVAPAELAVTAKAVTAAPEVAWSPKAAAKGVGVEVLDRAAAEAANIRGVLFRAGRSAGPVSVELDYSGFRHAFGGDYASRLRVVDVATGRTLPARNDIAAGRIQVDVTGATGRTRGPDGVQINAPAPLYALTSGTTGEAGSFAPTSLAPSATWAVGLQSGDFSWNHPIPVPPAPGPAPRIALSYSSGVVDGRTASTNNQASWVGEGFGYEPGFIERTYKPCAEDGEQGKADLCWDRNAAHIVLPGVSGELVWDAGRGVWKVANDEGWRVEPRTGAANGDNDGEHWLVTGPDGTRYSFGRAAGTAWTVPVFGNDDGEPCHGPAFDNSWCHQAYRWTLDTVTDTHGDQVAYHYETETNHYGRSGAGANATPYVRAGHLVRIDYGLREGGDPAARVLFTSAPRCIPGSPCDPARPADWPDTPWDLACSGGNCPAAGPSFWGARRLAKITTQVRSGAGYADVDSWTLDHVFPGTDDRTSPTLWLRSITRTGHVGGTATLPDVRFDGVLLANRIGTVDGLQPMNKWRLSRVHNEIGGTTEVEYSNDRCAAGALPRQDANEENCFPAYWLRQGASTPELGWFNKYVVAQVSEVDRVGGAPRKVTAYEYVDSGTASWRYDAAELVPGRFKTWGSWRGFQKVRVRTGDAAGPRTLTEHLFLRGMDGDLLLDGTHRKVEVEDSQQRKWPDKPNLAGFARETVVRDPATGAEISAEFQQPWLSDPTAVRDREGGPLEARILRVDVVQTRTTLPGGGTRLSETSTKHDQYGNVTEVHDRGDVAVPDDDLCTTTTYARNTDAWIVNRPSRVLTAGVPCGTTANPVDVVSDARTFYDGAESVDAPPTKGDVTRTEVLDAWDGAQPVYVTTSRAVHDAHGRVVESYDALGAKTTTAYQPPTGLVTATVVTNPLGHTTTTELDPARGSTVATVDANGRRSAQSHDPLGRLAAAWHTGRPVTETPTVRHEYLVRSDGPAVVTTHRLEGGQYTTSHTLYDGLLRRRQTQEPSPHGGRIVTDTRYDAHGRVSSTNAAYHNAGEPGTALLVVADEDVPSQEVVEYDGAGRTAAEVLRSLGVEKHRTTYSYEGDRVHEDPPAGGTPTTRITDVRGRLVELRQYTGDAPTGEFHATTYGYTKAGKRNSVVDAAGNAWRFDYDLRGRQVRVADPDKGVATMTYDAEDRLTSVTDARGVTLAHTYDSVDRRTGVFEGSPAGRRLTEWTFDTLPGGLGLPAASIRYVDGAAYRSDVLGYNDHGLPTGSAVTVPEREGRLAGRYESTVDYDAVGRVSATTLPAAGGLPAETLVTGRTALGQVATVTSDLAPYVADTGYSATGQVSHRVLGGRVVRLYAYDEATSRLTGLSTVLENGESAADVTVAYDAEGNVVSTADAVSGDAQCFRSDSFQRLVEAWTAADCAAGPSTAALGGPAPYWHSYGYDKAGNRTREVRHAAAGDAVREYAYPAAHRVASVTEGSRVDGYGYDAAGNTVTRPGQSLSWNAEGRLASVTAGTAVTSFEYDADGNRLIRRDPTGTTLYLGDTDLRLDAATGALSATRHYAVAGTPVAVRTEAGVSWLADDHAGTASVAVDGDDLAVTARRQFPYGEPRGAVPAWPGERGFVGGTVDASTGLTHLGAREYDPVLGAFLSVDPILNAEDPQQLQGYAYAGNSPVSHTDATGLSAEHVTEPAPPTWDSAVTAFRAGGDTGQAGLYTAHGGVDTASTASDSGGWSPKVPPGYTNPPGDTTPSFPGIPTTPPPTGPSQPDKSWSGKTQIVHDDDGGSGDYMDNFGAGDIEVRDLWEYDRCKPWNPCVKDTKPGMVKGYNPPGLYKDKKKGKDKKKDKAKKDKDKKKGKSKSKAKKVKASKSGSSKKKRK
ncbi:RHS repeat-associated core domain-containing protein [Saccharothrix sp.]|uniref:RHS repeat-associated core domain-containing protein n=1 Tax=Saccharothrix sp. TaxID=1873460 RepID=UPI002811EB1C|nr:RHS repeat-associated core domain-containing protein [Saccharothrix sp.]